MNGFTHSYSISYRIKSYIREDLNVVEKVTSCLIVLKPQRVRSFAPITISKSREIYIVELGTMANPFIWMKRYTIHVTIWMAETLDSPFVYHVV